MGRKALRSSLLVGVVCATAAVLMPDPASAGSELGEPVFKVARSPNGPFRQTVGANVPVGTQKTFTFKVKNPSDENGFVTLHGDENEDGFRYRFFRGSKNITEPIQADTYQLNLPIGKAKLITMKVKHQSMPGSTACAILSNGATTGAGVRLNGDTCG